MDVDVAELFEEVEFFAVLPGDELQRLVASARIIRLPAGSWLFRQNDPAGSLHIVRSGRLELVLESAHGTKVVGVAGRGAVVGELGIVAHSLRSASVRALRDTETVEVTSEHFLEVLTRHPAVAIALTRLLAGKLGRTDALRALDQPPTRTIALAALGGDVLFDDTVDHLVRAMGRFGPTTALSLGLDSVADEPSGRLSTVPSAGTTL